MADSPIVPTPAATPAGASDSAPTPLAPVSATNFLGDTPNAKKDQDNIYSDFFQEGDNGKITIGTKAKKPILETTVNILKYVTIGVITLVVLLGIHTSVRGIKDSSFFEGYPFLCPYLNYGVDAPEDKGCKTLSTLQTEYENKYKTLKDDISGKLAEYLPVNIGVSMLNNSPERAFAITTYEQKPHIDQIISAFERVKIASLYATPNIECAGISITDGYKLTTQCTVYGGPIGAGESNNRTASGTTNIKGILSARIIALQFLENIADTNKTGFILENPPTTLPIEKLGKDDQIKTGFDTKTIVTLQLRYIPVIKKP